MSGGWVTDTLIALPLAGALLVWLFPWNRLFATGIAIATAVLEIGAWATALAKFNFSAGGPQLANRASWFSDLHVSFHVGFYAFGLWLAGLTVVVMACSIAYGAWTGRARPAPTSA